MLPLIARARTLGLSMALATAGLGVVGTMPASAGGSTTWHVQAGNADDPTFTSAAQEVTTFYPARITVHPGDDVRFSAVGFHTVTFNPVRIPGGPPTFAYADPTFGGFSNNPLTIANKPGGKPLNSGGFGDGPPGVPATTYTLHIDTNAAGGIAENRLQAAKASNGDDGNRGTSYQFFCMLHRDMTGFITVLPAGSELPSTDARNQDRAAKAMAADLARGRRALANASRHHEDNQVAAGLGVTSVQGLGSDSILRFAPATIEINAGESLTWTNQDINAPHTVTFGVELPGPPGAPPGFLPYGGASITSASDQVNSGFLISQELIDYLNVSSLIPPGFVVTRQVTFTFPKAGTYHYFCALHDFLGMTGTVIVRAED